MKNKLTIKVRITRSFIGRLLEGIKILKPIWVEVIVDDCPIFPRFEIKCSKPTMLKDMKAELEISASEIPNISFCMDNSSPTQEDYTTCFGDKIRSYKYTLKGLRLKLEQAKKEERYEDCARIRDEIKKRTDKLKNGK